MDADIEALAEGGEGGLHDVPTGVVGEVEEPVEIGFGGVEAAGEVRLGKTGGLPSPVEIELGGG